MADEQAPPPGGGQQTPPPGGAGGAGGTGEGAGGAGGTGNTGGDLPVWKTLGIPEHMLKDSAEATLAEVYKGFRGFQEKQSAQGPVGKSADDYKFEFADEIKPWFGNADDPALANFRAVAHKFGLPVKTANAILNEVFGPLAKDGKLPKPYSPQAELDAMAKMLGKTGAEAAPAIEQAQTELQAWAANTGQQLKLTEDEQIELESLLLNASGFGLLRKLQGAGGGDGFRLGGKTPGALTRAELEAMQNDPRFDPASSKFDKAFRQRYEDGWRALPLEQLNRR
jgi:hypothetical protein